MLKNLEAKQFQSNRQIKELDLLVGNEIESQEEYKKRCQGFLKNVKALKEDNKKKAFSNIFENLGFTISLDDVNKVSEDELNDFIRIYLKVVENKKSEIEEKALNRDKKSKFQIKKPKASTIVQPNQLLKIPHSEKKVQKRGTVAYKPTG